jgi:hypothetical protein
MQSGERERAGTSKLRIENRTGDRAIQKDEDPIRGSGVCPWITAGAMVYQPVGKVPGGSWRRDGQIGEAMIRVPRMIGGAAGWNGS